MTLTPDYGLSYQRAQRRKLSRRVVRRALHIVNGFRSALKAAGFVDVAPADHFPPLDPAKLAVAFKQGFTGGGMAETVPAVGREKKFGPHVTVQAHQMEVFFKPVTGRSVSDILDDYEASKAIARNFRMNIFDLRMWRKRRRGKHFNDTVRA